MDSLRSVVLVNPVSIFVIVIGLLCCWAASIA
jgi:hypothetical protein